MDRAELAKQIEELPNEYITLIENIINSFNNSYSNYTKKAKNTHIKKLQNIQDIEDDMNIFFNNNWSFKDEKIPTRQEIHER